MTTAPWVRSRSLTHGGLRESLSRRSRVTCTFASLWRASQRCVYKLLWSRATRTTHW
jgi:hypothetical protein